MRFAFWVVSREQSVPGNPVYGDALDARPLSGGEELDHLRYNGPLAILGAEGLKICEAQVEVGHVYGRGMSWFLIPSLPLTFPFLLSDDLSIELVYDGEVAFSLDPSQKKNLRWKGTEDVVIA